MWMVCQGVVILLCGVTNGASRALLVVFDVLVCAVLF